MYDEITFHLKRKNSKNRKTICTLRCWKQSVCRSNFWMSSPKQYYFYQWAWMGIALKASGNCQYLETTWWQTFAICNAFALTFAILDRKTARQQGKSSNRYSGKQRWTQTQPRYIQVEYFWNENMNWFIHTIYDGDFCSEPLPLASSFIFRFFTSMQVIAGQTDLILKI